MSTAQYLLELDAWTGAGVETLYLGTKTFVTKPTDSPANTVYHGAMLNAGELNRQMFSNGGTIGTPSTNIGYFEIDNADGSRSSWLSYGVGGRKFRLYLIAGADADYSSRTLIYTGTIRGFASSDLRKSLQVRIRDKLEELDTPLLTDLYGGSTTSGGASNQTDGDATFLNVIKPRAFGDNLKFTPKCVSTFNLVYQCSNGALSLINVYDGGVQLLGSADFATVALLLAATIPAGEFATCLSAGVFQLKSAPVHQIICDCQAGTQTWGSGGFDQYEPGAVAKAILGAAGFLAELEDASFDNLMSPSGAGAYRCGIYLDDSTTVIDAVSKILSSVGAAITSTANDTFKAVVLSKLPLPTTSIQDILVGETPVDTFTLRDIQDGQFTLQASPQAEGDGVPAYWINLNYSPYSTTQSRGDLAGSVNDSQARDLALSYRTTVAQKPSIQTVHPLAQTLTFNTQLTDLQGVNRQAEHLLNLYGQRRDYITVTIDADRVDENAVIDLGDIVALDIDHLGYSPKNFYVIGRWDQFGSRKVTLTLWG